MEAWALLPLISCLYNCLSNEMDSVNFSTISVTLSSNLPPQSFVSFGLVSVSDDWLMVHHDGSKFGLALCRNGNMGLGLGPDWLDRKVDGEEKNGVIEEESNDSIIDTAEEKS